MYGAGAAGVCVCVCVCVFVCVCVCVVPSVDMLVHVQSMSVYRARLSYTIYI